jgi:hypothetical protein
VTVTGVEVVTVPAITLPELLDWPAGTVIVAGSRAQQSLA